MNENDKKSQSDFESKKLIKSNFEEVYQATPINEDTQCGYGLIKGEFLQK